jgi:Flp pilus assembly pilin Flp
MKSVTAFLLDESGATAIEFGAVLALVSLVVVTGASLAGVSFELLFGGVSDQLLQVGVSAGGTDGETSLIIVRRGE